MNRTVLWNIFLRSLTIQASFNFARMQSLGFVFALMPWIRAAGDPSRVAESLQRHLRMFNTHPYLSAPVIGATVRIEEEGDPVAADQLKSAVMGPYAAIGDPFFWGALRPFSAAVAVTLGIQGFLMAPLAFLALYDPAHFWVRGRGFFEGYRLGKRSIDFIRGLNLPAITGRIRYASLAVIGVLAAVAAESASPAWGFPSGVLGNAFALAVVVLCSLALRRGISQVAMLYGAALGCMALSV
jgi:PTS system mannose-specific IID component